MAAVLGRDFDYPPLAAALRASPDSAVAALDPAVSARLVTPEGSRAGAYRFTHALIRDAVEEQLSPSRRAELHARVFAALRDTGCGAAVRPGASRRPGAARGQRRRRGRRGARRGRGGGPAARLGGRRGLVADARHPAARRVDAALELRLGRRLLLAGQVDEAREHFEAAADEAARAGDGARLAAAALAAGDTVAEVAADHRLVTLLDRARHAPGLPPGTQARLAARWAIATYWQPGGQDQSRRASASAVELADEVWRHRGPRRGADRQAVHAARSRPARRAGDGRHAVLDIATRLGEEDLRFRAHQWLVPDHFQSGAIGLVTAGVEQMTAIAEARKSPLQRWWVLIYRGLLASFAGRLAEAERLAHEAAALGRRLGQPAADAYRVGQLGRVYWSTGRLAELEEDIADALTRFPGLVTLRCMRALADATAGRSADAAREVEALAADRLAALPRDSLYLASVAILGEAAVTCHAAELAAPVLDELAPYATRNLIQGVPVGWGAAAWHIARLEWLLGRRADAARSAQLAVRLHRQWGAAGFGHPLDGLGRDIAAVRLSRRESQVLSTACGRPGQRRDRRRPRRQRAHHRAARGQHLRQDRRAEPGRGDRLGAPQRAGRLNPLSRPSPRGQAGQSQREKGLRYIVSVMPGPCGRREYRGNDHHNLRRTIMTDPKISTIQSVYEAFGRGDLGFILDQLTDDVDWASCPGSDVAPWHGIHRGKAEVPNFFKALGGALQITEFTPLSFASNETDVMTVTRWSATARAHREVPHHGHPPLVPVP